MMVLYSAKIQKGSYDFQVNLQLFSKYFNFLCSSTLFIGNEQSMQAESINKHIKEIYKYKVYSVEEQTVLAIEALSGNTNSRDLLIKSNLRMVINIAGKNLNRKVSMEDLISIGNMAVIESLDKYDPSKGNFPSWAHTYIDFKIMSYINANDATVRVPHLKRAKGLKPPKTVSFDMPISSDTTETVEDRLADEVNQPTEVYEAELVSKELDRQIARLEPNLQYVIRGRFYKDQTLDEIAAELKLTRERIRQLEDRAIKILRNFSSIER